MENITPSLYDLPFNITTQEAAAAYRNEVARSAHYLRAQAAQHAADAKRFAELAAR